ncbi:hypothetical protein BH10BAC4_BH10BAC4_03950 [soil metagenome]
MKKRVLAFTVVVIIKGILLMLIVLMWKSQSIYFLLGRLLIFFAITGLVDWKVLNMVRKGIKNPNWLVLASFSYGSYVVLVWIVEIGFELYNSGLPVREIGQARFSVMSLVLFVLIGLLTSSAIATIITAVANRKDGREGRSQRSW